MRFMRGSGENRIVYRRWATGDAAPGGSETNWSGTASR